MSVTNIGPCECCGAACTLCTLETICVSLDGVVIWGASQGTVNITLTLSDTDSEGGCTERRFYEGVTDDIFDDYNCNNDTSGSGVCAGVTHLNVQVYLCCNEGSTTATIGVFGQISPTSPPTICRECVDGLCPDAVHTCVSGDCCWTSHTPYDAGSSGDSCISNAIALDHSNITDATYDILWTGGSVAPCMSFLAKPKAKFVPKAFVKKPFKPKPLNCGCDKRKLRPL